MRIVVIGGTGHIGSKLVALLRFRGHSVIAASRSSGVDVTTGSGLTAAVATAQVLIDATDAPSFDEHAALDFFVTSTRHLLAAAEAAEIEHYVAISVVGLDHTGDTGYFRGKRAQELLIKSSRVPYSIVRATQFFSLIEAFIRRSQPDEKEAFHVPPVLVRPMATEDVVTAIADIAGSPPLSGTIDLAGSETIALDELVRLVLSARDIPLDVIRDAEAPFFGAKLKCDSLLPGPTPSVGSGTVRDWLRHFITAD
jgi:uncharacterized protein YbjT (DUF2867 family)